MAWYVSEGLSYTQGMNFTDFSQDRKTINADIMNVSQIRDKMEEGLSDVEEGRVRSARGATQQDPVV
jgi:uncharacterized protein with HEPN domain